MMPSALFIISSDPRSDHRPAEAVRIAAGICAWKKNKISLYLHDAAVFSISEFADEWVDADNFIRYIPILNEAGSPIYVPKGSAFLGELGQALAEFREISEPELATIVSQSSYVLNF
jgi:sulfur relay (sulfurtransferase) DsrF/TusC family protein